MLGRDDDRGNAFWPNEPNGGFGQTNPIEKRYSSGGFARRRPLIVARRFLDSSRRSRAPAVGLVARRARGATAARRVQSRSRARTSSERLGEPRTSKRSCTALASLLTFCPPGPEARMKCSSSSSSPMLMEGVMRIIADPVAPTTSKERAPALRPLLARARLARNPLAPLGMLQFVIPAEPAGSHENGQNRSSPDRML